MKRFYGKQNGCILICSLIVAFLYLTVIDWEYRGTSLHNVLYIVTRYMEYQSILLGIAGMIVSWHYFCLIKEKQEGEFLYTVPITRSSFWKAQWIAVNGTIACSWAVVMILLFVLNGSYLKEVHAGWMLLSVFAYFLVDVTVVTFSMWMQMKIYNSRKALALSFGMIGLGILLLREISKYLIIYLHDTGIGLYAKIHNAWDTFLYSHQTMDVFYKMLLKYGEPEDVKLFLSGWQVDQYGIVYLVGTAGLLTLILLMTWSGVNSCKKLPYAGRLPKAFIFAGIWGLAFTIINELSFLILPDITKPLPDYISSVGIFHSNGEIRVILSCFSYYDYESIFEYHLLPAAVIAVGSLFFAVIFFGIICKKNAMVEKKRSDKEVQA